MPEVAPTTAPTPKKLMSPAELDYRRTEAQAPVEEFGDRVRAFLLHARDSRINGPAAVEVVEELPIDADRRQDAVIALETLGRLRDLLLEDTQSRGEDTPQQQVRTARSQPNLDPRHGAGRRGTRRHTPLSDQRISRIAHEDEPSRDDLGGMTFDEYIHHQANFSGEDTEQDVVESAHTELPEYDDGPDESPAGTFRREVRALCEGVCAECGERAARLIEAGVTTEKLLADMTAFIRQKAARLKPAGGEMQR
ncbi:MAG TPA: hypothetical protein PKV72_06070 [Candidatus Peribacteria bacterium]|nr:hypothetical protein [Candidatus Peribacteria bacterium]